MNKDLFYFKFVFHTLLPPCSESIKFLRWWGGTKERWVKGERICLQPALLSSAFFLTTSMSCLYAKMPVLLLTEPCGCQLLLLMVRPVPCSQPWKRPFAAFTRRRGDSSYSRATQRQKCQSHSSKVGEVLEPWLYAYSKKFEKKIWKRKKCLAVRKCLLYLSIILCIFTHLWSLYVHFTYYYHCFTDKVTDSQVKTLFILLCVCVLVVCGCTCATSYVKYSGWFLIWINGSCRIQTHLCNKCFAHWVPTKA